MRVGLSSVFTSVVMEALSCVFLLKLRTETLRIFLVERLRNDMFEQGFLHLYLVPVRR